MKTFKQFLAESKQLNESISLDDLRSIAYLELSDKDYRDKSFDLLNIDSNDELFDEIYSIKDKNKLYKLIKDVNGFDLKHLNDKQLKEFLYSLCRDLEWMDRIAEIMIKNNIGGIDKDWYESTILSYFEEKPKPKDMRLIFNKLGIV